MVGDNGETILGVFRRDYFRRFPTRQRSVSSELVMIGNARQRLSRFGVDRGKMEVLVWYGGTRETKRDEICHFGEWEMEEWRDSEIWYFLNCYVRQLSSSDDTRQWAVAMEVWKRER